MVSIEEPPNQLEFENELPNIIVEPLPRCVPTQVPSPPPSKSCWLSGCCSLRCTIITVFIILWLALLLTALIYFLLIPVIFRSSTSIQRAILFVNFEQQHLQPPSSYGLNCTVQFYLNSSENGRIGVWHIPPVNVCSEAATSNYSISPIKLSPNLTNASMVILYAHGNGCTRAASNRIRLYRVFSARFKAHVVTFDYRGYGDSSDALLTAQGLANDTRLVYEWILEQGVPSDKILMWGHSMGTAVSVRMLSTLPAHRTPMATVLEAPFTNFEDEIREHPLSNVYNYLPYFNYFFTDPIAQNSELNFDSLALLPQIKCPLLIMHARDDQIIPFWLGKKLYNAAKVVQPVHVANKTQFREFPSGKGYKHNWIAKAPELPDVVDNFIKSIQ